MLSSRSSKLRSSQKSSHTGVLALGSGVVGGASPAPVRIRGNAANAEPEATTEKVHNVDTDGPRTTSPQLMLVQNQQPLLLGQAQGQAEAETDGYAQEERRADGPVGSPLEPKSLRV